MFSTAPRYFPVFTLVEVGRDGVTATSEVKVTHGMFSLRRELLKKFGPQCAGNALVYLKNRCESRPNLNKAVLKRAMRSVLYPNKSSREQIICEISC
jgi:hypothetical protein